MFQSLGQLASSTFYFWFGVFCTLYLYILCFKRTTNKLNDSKAVVCRFYINIFFLNRDEFVRNIVRSKVPKSRPFIRALAKRAAVVLLSGEIVEKIGVNLCKTIPDRLELMGIKCNVNIGYTHAAFLCIEVALIKVDFTKFIWYNAGTEKSKKVKDLLDKIMFPWLENCVNKLFLLFLKGKLMKQLPVTLLDKLQDKMNAEIELVCCTEEEQGPFLVDTIQQMRVASSAVPAAVTAVVGEDEQR